MHFASALTLLDRVDGQGADEGASYLELADLLIRLGSNTSADLAQLWRRIVFSIRTSNTDDHLRYHGFTLTSTGWALAPAYDMNPNPEGAGLALNVSETDNALELNLALSVASTFCVNSKQAKQGIADVARAVQQWRSVAATCGLSRAAQDRMSRAFRAAG